MREWFKAIDPRGGWHSVASAFVFLLGLSVLSFVVFKSLHSSFTHDESYTYLHYPQATFFQILSFGNSFTNNHVLNSLLMKYSEVLFGNSEFALRLPNLLSFVLYMVYCFRFFRHQHPLLRVAFFVLFCANHVVADLFGLARGYGLSMAFMMMSLYHLVAFIDQQRKKDAILFHLAATLAALSNFSLLPFYAASLAVAVLFPWVTSAFGPSDDFRFWRSIRVHVAPLMVVVAVLYEPVRRLMKQDGLTFGGKSGLMDDTVSHLAAHLFHRAHLSEMLLFTAQLFIAALVVSVFVLAAVMWIKKNKLFFHQQSALVVSNLVLLVMAVLFVLLHHILNIDYPVSRFSAFLVPLFLVQFCFSVAYLYSLRSSKLLLGMAVLIAGFSGLNFIGNADVDVYAEWQYDSETKAMIETMLADMEADEKKEVVLRGNWQFEPTVNFYRSTMKLDGLNKFDRNGVSEPADYYYVFVDELAQFDEKNVEVLRSFESTGTLLLKTND